MYYSSYSYNVISSACSCVLKRHLQDSLQFLIVINGHSLPLLFQGHFPAQGQH